MNPETIAIIPARAGSKGIRNKNISPVGGKPLIAWTIEAAAACKAISRTIVSTDSSLFADVARQHGAEVPFLRPPELAKDDTPGIAPVIHAIEWLATHQNYRPEYIMLLQPTSPLRTANDIDSAIQLARTRNADSVVSVCEVSHHPYWTMKLKDDGSLASFLDLNLTELQQKYPRRQDLPKAYAENGAIYLVRCSVLRESRTLYGTRLIGYVMPMERSLDIDTPLDLRLADEMLRR